MRAALLIAVLAACGSDDNTAEPDAMLDHEMCLGDEETLTPGTTAKLGDSGVLKIHVLATDPVPLAVGNNSIDVRVTDADDVRVDGVTFDVVETWQRIHNHGSPIEAEVTPLANAGEFSVSPMNVVHRGSWLFRFGPNAGAQSDLVEFNWAVDCSP